MDLKSNVIELPVPEKPKRTGFNRGDKVTTPDGEGIVDVGVSYGDANEHRYYWVDVGDERKRYEANQLPDPSVEEN